MTQLLLIRHGQASFGGRDYDRLSTVGQRQARLVGRHLAASGQGFDTVLSGRLRRQRDTAGLAVAGWNEAPVLQEESAFDEYDADALFAAYLPGVLADDPDLAAQRDGLFDDPRLFQQAFEQVIRRWLADAPPAADCERGTDFRARVVSAFAALRKHHARDARIGIFTSGGPIAVAVAAATEASDAKTIELNWSVRNAAVTELRATPAGWRVTGFNDIAAQRAASDPALITYR